MSVQPAEQPEKPPQKQPQEHQSAAEPDVRLAAALESIRAVVGDGQVLDRWDQLEPLARDTLPSVHAPAAFVTPANTDEVRSVVQIAHEHSIPLWPISRGRNWAYGASTPVAEGTIVLSLERMNRIVEVNAELAYAVIEPGVTFGQLQEHLERNRIPLCIDPTDSTPHGSIIGNALDRGIGTTPYGDHFGNLCGLEVVLADGRVLTPNGAADSKVRHTYKWGTGPYLEGLFGQSGAGIVTQAGVWLMPAPESFQFFLLELRRAEDVPQLVDEVRRLVLEERVRTRVHFINDVGRMALATRRTFDPSQGAGRGRAAFSAEEVARLRHHHGLPPWLLAGGLYGTRQQVREQQHELRRAIGKLGRLRFFDDRSIGRVRGAIRALERMRSVPGLAGPAETIARRLLGKSLDVLETLPHAYDRARGRPTEHFLRFAYYKASTPLPAEDVHPARDGGGLIWSAPSMPLTGRDLTELLDLCRPLFAEYGFDFTVAVMPHNARSAAFVMGIHYFKHDPEEADRAKALYERLREVTLAAGYPQYRISTVNQDRTFPRDSTFWELANRVHRALDPDGIIAPGRYGVGAG